MRLYPDIPDRRLATIARDVLVVALIGLFAYLGVRVHDKVTGLAVLGQGVSNAGSAVQGGLNQAGDVVGAAPVVGGQLRDALQAAAQQTGGRAAELGQEGAAQARSLGRLLGWLTFLLPTLLLLSRALPPRIAQVRRLTAASQVLERGPSTPERRALLARRAAFGLPYATLLRHTRDPLGDLEAGRHDALVAAELEDAGLEAR